MPVHPNLPLDGMIFQRDQYSKPGIGRWYWDRRDETILSWIKGDRIVDIGCGEGILLEKMIRRNPAGHSVGIDIEPLNIDICIRHHLPVVRCSAENVPFRNEALDTALLIEVIEHLRHPASVLAEIFRILRPGGRLILLFPNDAAFFTARIITGRLKEAFYDAGHNRQWRPRSCKNILRTQGFTLLHEEGLPINRWPLSLHYLLIAEKSVWP